MTKWLNAKHGTQNLRIDITYRNKITLGFYTELGTLFKGFC